MLEYDIDYYVHEEIIDEMTTTEKYELLQEIQYLIQNNDARISAANEGGFKHLFKVLTGKNRILQNQINVDQQTINKIYCYILTSNEKKSIETDEKIINLQLEIQKLNKELNLNNVYTLRMADDMKINGINTADTGPLVDIVKQHQLNCEKAMSDHINPTCSTTMPNNNDNVTNKLAIARNIRYILDKRIHSIPKYSNSIFHTYDSSEIITIPKKIDNAKRKFGYRSTGNIIGLIDTSVFNNGKEGILFTTEGVSFDYLFDKVFIRYTEIDHLTLYNKKLIFSGHFPNSNFDTPEIDCGIWGMFDLDINVLKSVLEEIIAESKNV